MLWRRAVSVGNNVEIIKHASYIENGKAFDWEREKKYLSQPGILDGEIDFK